MLAAGAGFTILVAVLIVLAPTPLALRLVWLVGVSVAMVTWLACVRRMAAMGVYVSGAGLRVRRFVTVVTIPWDDVADVRVGEFTASGWGAWPFNAQSVWIDRRSGPAVQTPLISKSAEFLGRRGAFDAAFRRVHAGWLEAGRRPY